MTGLPIGVIADDLTGAADIGGILTRAGARAVLCIGVPSGPVPPAAAVVIALKTRSVAPDQAVAQSLQALGWLRSQSVRQVVFKICSTFDSTPEGNIGPVAMALCAGLEAPGAVVCPAFPANGRTVYQGHLFVADRLLSESGMQHHPLNPMTDPDLRRWLGRQVSGPVGHLPLAALRAGLAGTVIAAEIDRGAALVIADAIEDADLTALGAAVVGHRLVVGGSAIAAGLVAALALPDAGAPPGRPAAPGLILSGSCSAATLDQVATHALRHPHLPVAPADLDDPDRALTRAIAFLNRHRDARPLVSTSAGPESVRAAQARHGRADLARRIERFLAGLAQAGVALGFRGMVVAGGETSGAVAQALDPGPCAIGAEIAPGVPSLYPVADGPGVPAGLVLKSGNFGGARFFREALDALAAGR